MGRLSRLEEPPYLPVVRVLSEFLDLFDETLLQRKVITRHAAGIDLDASCRPTPPSASRRTTSRGGR